jgi:membrane associated rhomboid family serine protease
MEDRMKAKAFLRILALAALGGCLGGIVLLRVTMGTSGALTGIFVGALIGALGQLYNELD